MREFTAHQACRDAELHLKSTVQLTTNRFNFFIFIYGILGGGGGGGGGGEAWGGGEGRMLEPGLTVKKFKRKTAGTLGE